MKSKALLISRAKSGRRGDGGSRCSHLSGGRNHFNTVALITNETDATRKTSSRRKKEEGFGWPGLIKRLRHYALSAVTSPKSVGAISNSRDTAPPTRATPDEGEAGLGNRGPEHALGGGTTDRRGRGKSQNLISFEEVCNIP